MSKQSAKKALEALSGEILPRVEDIIPPSLPRYAGYCEKIAGTEKLELNIQMMMHDFIAFSKAAGIEREKLLQWITFTWGSIEAAKISKA